MNQELSDILIKYGIVLKNTKSLDIHAFSKKKKLICIYGENTNKQCCLILFSFAKSKILIKESLDFEDIFQNLSQTLNLNFQNYFIFHQALICSKAKEYLATKGIKNYAFM
ncbi:hypothetical protein L8Y64_06620 [Campylobacter lari]|uniref:Tram-like protein n=1 Tax=Campylobacter lari TaxID=201 RepID=A0A5N7GEX6_CAMLA|nr:hypothetical protein [Campylobacter lari]AJC88919.1 hypothetical protein CONCH_0488 [Campylobacter lari subsp. concheus LMG 11760]EAC1840600.1 hypothetical protein [Campylobacter lari]EAH7030885.1 hypothetical protein [Campylobacter lari]EAH7580949.1 hypothetical protein [Campylobacter lari]EAH7780929.1 hypothetical protein [Campylobacter lari]